MEYIVIRAFTDKDDGHHYAVGDRYPYRGFARKERLEELSTDKNKRGVALIAEKKAEKPKKAETEKVETAKVETKKKSAKVLTLDSIQSTTAKQAAAGTTYLKIMEANLAVLEEALR